MALLTVSSGFCCSRAIDPSSFEVSFLFIFYFLVDWILRSPTVTPLFYVPGSLIIEKLNDAN